MSEPINCCPETGIPYCPDCNKNTLGYAPAKGRDTETMGGYSVEYLRCDECGQEFEYINGNISPIFS